MIAKLIKYGIKWTTTALVIGYLTYNCHSTINKTLNNVKFFFNPAEQGFVKKQHALDLKFDYELNGKGNLETYLKNYSIQIPVFERNNGLMIGSADYNFSNFTQDEASQLCRTKLSELENKVNSSPDFKTKVFKIAYDLFGGENG